MATGGGRAGPEPSSRGTASRAPEPSPGPGSPACGSGLAPFGVTASSSPSPRSPNHWDPGLASGSSSSLGSGGAAIAGSSPGAATAAWRGRGAVTGREGGQALPAAAPAGTQGLGRLRCQRRRRRSCCNSGRAAACRFPRFSSSSSPSTSSRPRPGRCLRSSSYSRRRRRCRFATPKPVITQVKKACLVRVFLCTRQPPLCRPTLGDVPHPLESSSHLGENQRG